MRLNKILVAFAILTCFQLGACPAATAVTFTPVACSACPAYTAFPWPYASLTELATDPNHSGGNYINNMAHTRSFVANGYVSDIAFHFSSFVTEYNFDFVTFQQDPSSPQPLSGTISPNWIQPALTSAPQSKPVQLSFSSDATFSFPGFTIDQVEVCCTNVGSAVNFDMVPGRRYEGLLQGVNDVVYLRIPPGPTGTQLNLALWGAGTGGQDFDLYARCGQLPTPTAFDMRGYSTDPNEFVTSSTNQCAGSSWYVAVSAYAGSGQFSLTGSYLKSAKALIPVTVGIDVNAAPSQLTQVGQTMTQALRYFYGLTEGQVLVAPCDIWNNTGTDCTNCNGAPCDVCFVYDPGDNAASQSSLCTGPGQGPVVKLTFSSGYWTSPSGVAHELAHKYLCTTDEYNPAGCSASLGACTWHCGHSIMANPFAGQNNLCIKQASGLSDHEKDPSAGWGVQGTASSWDLAVNSGRVVASPTQTPDNFSFVTHDFNNAITCTQH